jgi:hypothetical protein
VIERRYSAEPTLVLSVYKPSTDPETWESE